VRLDVSEGYFEGGRAKLSDFNDVPAPARETDEDGWLVDAADLLAEPDPGPMQYLVEDLIVEGALTAAVGRWKTTKSYAMLELAISIVSGRPAFGELEIPKPGPVVYVIEESGRDALWRRLDSLSRGRAIPREELRGLLLAPNEGVKLDDPDWQARLVDLGQRVKPRLLVFDPVVRMKKPARDESAQKDMGAVIEFLRDLQKKTGAAVAFVQHQGHQGEHMRGTSDLESVWESRLAWKKGEDGLIELASEHREAEAGPTLRYRISWDAETRTIRFPLEERPELPDDLLNEVRAYLVKNPDASASTIAAALKRRKAQVLQAVKEIRFESPDGSGTGSRGRSGAGSAVVPARAPFPVREGPSGTAGCGVVPELGDEMFPVLIAEALQHGHITEDECSDRYALHKFVERSRKVKT
jgi:hypothetical protein